MSFAKFLFKQIDIFGYIPQNTYHNKNVIKLCENVVYRKENFDCCRLDIYCHKDKVMQKQPIFINIHGGGFMAGDKTYRNSFAKYVANQGFKVVNINYGLAPQYKFPDLIIQIHSLFDWLKANAENYDLDLNKIIVSGDSAGGYFATCMCVLATNNNYAKLFNLSKIDIKISGVALFSGIYYPTHSFNKKMIFNVNQDLWHALCGEKFIDIETCKKNKYYNLLDVADYITDFPATFITYSDNDIFCSGNGDKLTALLKQKNIPIREVRSITNGHDWQEKMDLPASKITLKEFEKFLSNFLADNISTENNETTVIKLGRKVTNKQI